MFQICLGKIIWCRLSECRGALFVLLNLGLACSMIPQCLKMFSNRKCFTMLQHAQQHFVPAAAV
jgi:hypothetical protein